MRRERGVEVRERRFLKRKRWGERVMSEREAKAKVRVERVRPIIVRYWKCQP